MLPELVEVEKEFPGILRPLCSLTDVPDHVPVLEGGLDAEGWAGSPVIQLWVCEYVHIKFATVLKGLGWE